ncbi:DUF6261 family protein [Ekhidna sp.]|uniref:DUF6261 family protein n=1 Tax=Ekhidna sp. TaxID=2608089 RepID=UPI0032EB3491
MLKQFSHSLLTSEELVVIAERLIQAVSTSGLKDTLGNRIKKTTDASSVLSDTLNKGLSNVHASRVQQADLLRDDAFQAFKYGVLSASYRTETSIKQAGEKLVEVVRKRGFSLYNLGYIAQSEAMRSLVEDLERCADEISHAGVADLLEEMLNAHESFDKIYHEKTTENTKNEPPQVVVWKTELSKQITLFLNHVELLEEDKEEGVETLVDKLNIIITDMMQEAKERQQLAS